MMEEQFRPRGGLGLIKSDLKHIEFYDENKFDESFEELTTEIDAIASGSQTASRKKKHFFEKYCKYFCLT